MRTAKASLMVTIVTCTLAVAAYANATENAKERRDARDTKQSSRQDARATKRDCREANEKSNADCRQDKRSDKQKGRQESRDVRAGKPATTK
jgi:Ni/Co efflux regulator RcnB